MTIRPYTCPECGEPYTTIAPDRICEWCEAELDALQAEAEAELAEIGEDEGCVF